jgi:cytochrome c oxidase assembly protein subunit 15
MFTSRTYHPDHDRQLALWLLTCALVIYGMILLGGVTRLTESGLSMVEWRPIMGIVPPVGEAAWQAAFEKYQQFPEYQKINRGMSLDEFKVIFMYEYLHRVLGTPDRPAVPAPAAYFALRGRIRPGLMPRLLLLFVLGGCQGLLGWYMVKSGLVDRPACPSIGSRLTWAWRWRCTRRSSGRCSPCGRARAGRWGGGACCAWGVALSLFAGVPDDSQRRSGRGHGCRVLLPDLAAMGPGFVPPGLYATSPAWLAAFEDVTTIQFNHRMFAYLLFFCWSARLPCVLACRGDRPLLRVAALVAAWRSCCSWPWGSAPC